MKYNPEIYSIPDEPMKPFIDSKEISDILINTKPDKFAVRDIIAKSLAKNRLTMQETAILTNAEGDDLIEEIKDGARELKRKVYGDRIVLFAPLYVGNYCSNNCAYCGFKHSNKEIVRKTLANQELIKEVRTLENHGHKRLILVFGEHQIYSPEFIAESVKTVYSVKENHGEIRRVNINAAPQDIDGFRTIHESGIGTYQIFQETYHAETYKKVHISGRKSNYDWRLTALDRAMEAGIDDVGIGALFGLYDWRFEVLGLVRHVNHFESVYNVGPHTISFPRIQYASEMNLDMSNEVSDRDFTKLVAILRLAVPYTGMILTARESAELRDEIMQFGVSQIDGGTNIELGGYSEENRHLQNINKEQFTINDNRSLNEIIHELLEGGLIPSFCTACYRMGRTGEHFMEFAVPGFVKKLCSPNAILTLAEYLEDYAPHETKTLGYNLIDRKLAELETEQNIISLKSKLELIKEGKRDLYF
ncbi:MAG: [FeFe] hydrogenase H-cluster radical SAM maturase HydG [Candidatus Kapabacteria bacterium]|nr:[FeFe] hydrogenase H-cluster radical SAM maturase HydG [Ignavibacteriota bacterium]MCW5884386.1 [FeFe] hydrogenase H-cluster radical SAM maturase HydG [Candidatus Kapabacteria bacterium]